MSARAMVSSVTLTSTAFDADSRGESEKRRSHARYRDGGKTAPEYGYRMWNYFETGDASPRNAGATLYGDVVAMDDSQMFSRYLVRLLRWSESGNTISGTTGADGTASFTLRQDNTGYKTPPTHIWLNYASWLTRWTLFLRYQPARMFPWRTLWGHGRHRSGGMVNRYIDCC
ncbi:hypothetical protein MJ590_12910 [Escherichia coli]|nr:hypothetical protein MJ590_12910 [Escherichia coli]